MKKILIPCDFTDSSTNALKYGVQIAKYLSSQIVLLHINQIPVMNAEFGLAGYSISETYKAHKDALQNIAIDIKACEPSIGDIECHCEMGDPTDVIISFSEANHIDLIIAGIGGHGNGFMKNVIGSTSVAIAANVSIPLIIVPPEAKFKKIEQIAYACKYELTLEENASLIKVKYFSTLFDSTLHILHVIAENHELSKVEAKIDNYVEHALETIKHKTYIITENNKANGILNFINNHDIDMVMIEAKKHSWLYNIFHGNTMNAMAFYSPVAVLTIHG